MYEDQVHVSLRVAPVAVDPPAEHGPDDGFARRPDDQGLLQLRLRFRQTFLFCSFDGGVGGVRRGEGGEGGGRGARGVK